MHGGGSRKFCGHADGQISVYIPEDGKLVLVYTINQKQSLRSGVHSMSALGSQLCSIGAGGVFVTNLDTKENILYKINDYMWEAMCMLCVGNQIFIGEESIIVIDTIPKPSKGKIDCSAYGFVLCLTEMNGMLYSGHKNGYICVWDLKTRNLKQALTINEELWDLVAFGGYLYCGTENGNIYIFDLVENNMIDFEKMWRKFYKSSLENMVLLCAAK